jgi:hypothetical protein
MTKQLLMQLKAYNAQLINLNWWDSNFIN